MLTLKHPRQHQSYQVDVKQVILLDPLIIIDLLLDLCALCHELFHIFSVFCLFYYICNLLVGSLTNAHINMTTKMPQFF